MATGPFNGVLDHVRRVALREQDAGLTDGELLSHYLARRDEAAFAALVRRHGPMVYGVCRRLLCSEADAEDAFQATFLVLVRKAASVRPRERVANWLHGVAWHTAQKARAMAGKRRAKERRAGEMRRPDAPKDVGDPLLPLLDDELRRLPENYRLPIVLCELEGKTHQEAVRQLGWPVGTVSGRLSRGRALLARRLKRRGAAPPDLAPTAVPPALTAAAVKAATAFAAGSAAAAVSAKVVALAEGASKAMLLTKLKAITTILLIAVLAGAGAAVAFASMPGREGRAPMKPDATEPSKPEKAADPAPPDPEEKAVRDYVAELRAAVKNPTDDHHVYREVIDRRFHKAVTWAARHGEDDLVVELIHDYYGPGNPDRGGTALTWAAWLNDGETVQILLDRGAKVDAADNGGRTALHLAVGWGPNMTKLLLDKGADVNARTKSGETPLMAAARVDAATITEAPIDQATTVHLLLDKGADVNAQDDGGRTALMVAGEQGHLQNAKALLAEGANVRLKDNKGQRAIDLVKPAEDYLHLTGAWTKEGFERRQAQAEKDAEAVRALLKRAGGKE